MKKALATFGLAACLAGPAYATGGLTCRTAGARPIEVAVGFGHVPGSPLIARRLLDNGRNVPVQDAQWWLDRREVRLLLTSPQATAEELRLIARRTGSVYDGSLWRKGRRRWVRCREG